MFARVRLSFLASVTAVAVACTSTHAIQSTVPGRLETSLQTEPECYSVSYSDSSEASQAWLFPTWIELLPGSDAGPAIGRHHPRMSEASWSALLKYAGWTKIAGDSLEVMFTGSFEGIRIRAARMNGSLSGRATWLTDVIGLPTTSLELVGIRESCPLVTPRAT
jgi:hypothetical protein